MMEQHMTPRHLGTHGAMPAPVARAAAAFHSDEALVRSRLRATTRAVFRRHGDDPDRALLELSGPIRETALELKWLGVPLSEALDTIRWCVRDSRHWPDSAHNLARARAYVTRWVRDVYRRAD
jgi:hypothetical protein